MIPGVLRSAIREGAWDLMGTVVLTECLADGADSTRKFT